MACEYYKNSYACGSTPCSQLNPDCKIVKTERQKERIYSIQPQEEGEN